VQQHRRKTLGRSPTNPVGRPILATGRVPRPKADIGHPWVRRSELCERRRVAQQRERKTLQRSSTNAVGRPILNGTSSEAKGRHRTRAKRFKADTKIVKNRRVYDFRSFSANFSSGKKQGEISCFDIAYILFADDEGIPAMHFLLNDKKELMHDNQLVRIAHLVNERGIQFVASILQDKLPEELKNERSIVLRLSQTDKLFRIEGNGAA